MVFLAQPALFRLCSGLHRSVSEVGNVGFIVGDNVGGGEVAGDDVVGDEVGGDGPVSTFNGMVKLPNSPFNVP